MHPQRSLLSRQLLRAPIAMIATFKRLWQNSRALRWSTAGWVAILGMIALAMIYLLTQATTNNSAIYERNYQRLLIANLVVVAALLAVLF